jgi:DNA repair exonuclease SbcCD nuclease subunit
MLKILNDTHIGAKRMAGTTPASQIALRSYITDNFREALNTPDDVLVLGDLFDSYSAPLVDVVNVFEILLRRASSFPKAFTWVVAGNHDLSKVSTTMSSFQALKGLLRFAANIQFILEPTQLRCGLVIPHMVNQTAFDEALSKVTGQEYLFLHCNYDNGFAEQSDHSLNLSAQVAEKLPVKYIVTGHEHANRKVGNVHIPGVQWATSVADCLGANQVFYHTVLTKRGPEFVEATKASYEELPVFSTDTPTSKFVRIVGERPKADIEQVLKWVNNLRQNSDAFVITNAVKFQSEDGGFSLEDVGNNVKAFDVRQAVKETLTPAELAIFESAKC